MKRGRKPCGHVEAESSKEGANARPYDGDVHKACTEAGMAGTK